MARQWMIAVLLLLGLGTIHMAGTHRPQAPVASKDPYAWLGPLPGKIDHIDIGPRWKRLVDEVVKDARAADVRRFVCKIPAEVGALPMMQAVVRYADGLPGSLDDQALADGLSQAAARGNWLARAQLFSHLRETEDMATRYRLLQLAEWLHRHRLGHLYVGLEDQVWASPDEHDTSVAHDPSRFVAAAAMHHDYAAQASVGRALIEMDDPELVAAGGRMLACAASARDLYRKTK
ncbi:hypothetical protein [Pseudoduganella umbonata]|uniref:Uncharacterized protein n=1 Tax=Pseudoduganella umbonata TaxID=864828 RepID=A0A4P8HPT5_9BURK|nr:hypothetical protein [Pseudoduganella umbonata]MBB3220772.1 hypothetical protein [Pseudoduganella umbonata]QCP11757.1 hypothetical protein FCL38_16010 [Pseudoduganella umbonata]